MKPAPLEEGTRWLLQAQRDISDAEYAHSGERFNLTCFLAQQATEKVIKGYLYAQGRSLVIGYSVARLCRDAADFDPEFEDLRRQAASLDKYYIPTRYPNGLPGGIPAEAFDEIDADRALELARYVIQFIKNRFPPEGMPLDEAGGE